MKKLTKFTAVVLTTLAVLIGIGMLFVGFENFLNSLTGYYKVRRTDSKDELLYRLGPPEYVWSKPSYNNADYDISGQLFTDTNKHPKDSIPANKTPVDYDQWVYKDPNVPWQDFTVDFDSATGKVASITCDGFNCQPIAGIEGSDTEEQILRKLGKPSMTKLDNGTKWISYDDLGVRFELRGAEECGVIVFGDGPRRSFAGFLRYLRTFLTKS